MVERRSAQEEGHSWLCRNDSRQGRNTEQQAGPAYVWRVVLWCCAHLILWIFRNKCGGSRKGFGVDVIVIRRIGLALGVFSVSISTREGLP